MNTWNIQSKKDLWNEPIDWSGTYYSVILKNGQEREVRTYADECANGTINAYWEYTDDDSGVDFDDILLWRPIEKHDYEGMVEKFKAVVNGKTKEELAELFEEPEEPVNEDLEEALEAHRKRLDYWGLPCGYKDASCEGFKKGANWQKEQEMQDRLKSDNTVFQKFYEKGKVDMKEEMMKDALKAWVAWDENDRVDIVYNHDVLRNILKRHYDGEHIKVIIVKEDKQ